MWNKKKRLIAELESKLASAEDVIVDLDNRLKWTTKHFEHFKFTTKLAQSAYELALANRLPSQAHSKDCPRCGAKGMYMNATRGGPGSVLAESGHVIDVWRCMVCNFTTSEREQAVESKWQAGAPAPTPITHVSRVWAGTTAKDLADNHAETSYTPVDLGDGTVQFVPEEETPTDGS